MIVVAFGHKVMAQRSEISKKDSILHCIPMLKGEEKLNAWKNLYILQRESKDTTETIYYLKALYKEAENQQNNEWENKALYFHLLYYYNLGTHKPFMSIYNRLVPLLKQQKDNELLLQVMSLKSLSMFYRDNKPLEAIDSLLEIKLLSEKLQSPYGLMLYYASTAEITFQSGDYDRAITLLRKALEVHASMGNGKKDHFDMYHLLSLCYLNKEDYKGLYHCCREYLPILENENKACIVQGRENDRNSLLLGCYSHLALACLYLDNIDEAELIMSQMDSCRRINGLMPIQNDVIHTTLAKYLVKKGDYAGAYLELEQIHDRQTSYLMALEAEVLEKMGRKEEALDVFKQLQIYHSRNDSINIERKLAETEGLYRENLLKSEISRTNSRLQIFKGIGVAIVIVFMFFIIYIYRLHKRDLEQYRRIKTDQKQKEIEASGPKENMLVPDENIISENCQLFFELEKLMKNDHIYTDPELSWQELCKRLYTNEKYLYRIVKECSSQTVHEYINTYRLEMSKQLMDNTSEKKLNEIAQLSGFNSLRTFQRLFKIKYGISPTEYRNFSLKDKIR